MFSNQTARSCVHVSVCAAFRFRARVGCLLDWRSGLVKVVNTRQQLTGRVVAVHRRTATRST